MARKKQPAKQMFAVTLYLEVPAGLEPPTEWNWNNLVNHDGTTDANNTPVRFVTAYPVQEGTA